MGATRFLRSIRFWVTACVVVRLAALFLMPIRKEIFLNREMSDLAPAHKTTATYFKFLQRRTEFNPLTEDERCYDAMAANIVASRGFTTDFVWIITTPGAPAMYGGCAYPLFVAGVYALFGADRQLAVFLIQIGLQGLAVWFVFQVGRELAGETTAGIAAAFFTFHPVLIWVSLALLTESILVPCLAGLLWIMICRRMTSRLALATGALLAVMALTRSTMGALVWVTAGWIVWRDRRMWKAAAVMMGTFVLVCAPWTIRNYAHWNRFIPFSTKSGVNAWFFNNPGLQVEFSRRAVEGPQPVDVFDAEIQTLPDEAARNDRLMQMFKAFVREQPGKFVGLCWMRFWMAALPVRITSTSVGALMAAWYAKGIPWVILVAAGMVRTLKKHSITKTRCSARPTTFVVLMILYWQGIQSLAGPGLRYRLPVEPAWAVIVGIAAASLIIMLRERPRAVETPNAPAR